MRQSRQRFCDPLAISVGLAAAIKKLQGSALLDNCCADSGACTAKPHRPRKTLDPMSEFFTIQQRPPRATVIALLEAEDSPVSDLSDAHLEHFFFAEPAALAAGVVGLELYAQPPLLRSLAVRPSARTQGVGSSLVQHAERYAASQGAQSLYLLTTTAEAFFKRLGYERLDRSQAPPSMQRTQEFAELCPERSALMTKSLKRQGDPKEPSSE